MRDYYKSSKTKGIIAGALTLALIVYCTVIAGLVIYNTQSYSPAIASPFDLWVISLIFAVPSLIPVTVLAVVGIVHGAKAIKKEGRKGKAALALNIAVLCLSQLFGWALLFTHIIIISMTF